jgi:hypothetical protein
MVQPDPRLRGGDDRENGDDKMTSPQRSQSDTEKISSVMSLRTLWFKN